MKVPLLDLKPQYEQLRPALDAAVMRVAASQHFVLGPEVAALEAEIAAFCGVAEGVGLSSGSDSLLAVLMALGVGPGDEVITTAFSFFATAGSIARLGAIPVFVDIDPDSLNLLPEAAAAAITPRTKVILPVHLFGRMCEMDRLMAVAARHGLPVVEDAAQAIGAEAGGIAGGRRAGSFGIAGCFSFFPSKNLGAWGDGGMAVPGDADLARQLRVLRQHGSEPRYIHSVLGGNFRLDALQAAVLRAKLPALPGWTDGRRRNAARYRAGFAARGLLEHVATPQDAPGHIYNQFVIRARGGSRIRDDLRAWLSARDIGTEIYYPLPLPHQPCFAHLGCRAGQFPAAEQAAQEVLALPIFPELSADQSDTVMDAIQAFFLR